jgi:Rps23 Pro-64 3,4-dihydroxylase Tpa1-like proline 4-hydroxylase
LIDHEANYESQRGSEMSLDRSQIASEIEKRLDEKREELTNDWQQSGPISHFIVDDILPPKWAHEIYDAFPAGDQMMRKRSLRELKYVAAQMNKYNPLLEEAIYAFQAPGVVARLEKITGLRALEPDDLLYAGGISMMGKGHFLNPHVDNSHDRVRERYRVLNLLFYASPNWAESNGGNLELWPHWPSGTQTSIISKFNRLVVMATHQGSWHSVSKNLSDDNRCCVSNYYFSRYPIGDREYFHVTSFRGRPEQGIRDLVLRADIWLRMALRKLFPKGIKENPHYYDKGRSGRRQQ